MQSGWVSARVVHVVACPSGAGDVKDGALRFLSADGRTEPARISLFNPGICELAERAADSAEAEDVLIASIFCERMELTIAKGPKG